MNSSNTREIETQLSVGSARSLIIPQLEGWFRALGIVGDVDTVLGIDIGSIKGKDTDLLPVKLKIKREEVEVIRHG